MRKISISAFLLFAFGTMLFSVVSCKKKSSDPTPVTTTPTTTTTTTTTKTLVKDTIYNESTSQYGKVSSLYPTTAYTSVYCLQANVWTKGGTPLITRGYYTMDLSSLPTDTTLIESATMVLHSNFDSSDPYYEGPSPEAEATSNAFTISRVTSAWSPSTLTWNNQPTVSASDTAYVAGNSSASAEYIVDVTHLVRRAIFYNQANYGFQIRLNDETTLYNSINIITGNSKPADRAYAEKLAVSYYK